MTFILSYTALLFGGAPPGVQAQGLFMLLLSCFVLAGVGGWLSTLPSTFVSTEGTTVAVLAPGAASVIAGLAGAPPGVLGATLTWGLMLTAIVTGCVVFGLGWVRGGAIARFVPLQVMAGVTCGTGWLLVAGGVTVAIARPFSAPLLTDPAALIHLAPAVAGAAFLLFVTPRVRSPLVLPGTLAAGVALHHIVFAALGRTLGEQRAEGWLLVPPPRLIPTLPWSPEILGLVDWPALSQQGPALAATVAVACVSVLLGASGMELSTRQDVDLDRDLRANGIASVMSGLAGGVLGNTSLSRSNLLFRMGGGRRWMPAAIGLVAGLIPMMFPVVLGLLPRPVMGGLLIFIGAGILRVWLIETRQQLTWAEWLTVPAVVAIVMRYGLPAGVFAGLALGCITFAIIYSLGSPIRARYGGDVAHSNVDRPPAERAALAAQMDAVLVLYLQGYLFFGTASRVLREVKDEIASSGGRLRHLVLDCSNIDGLDGSARAAFERLVHVTAVHGITLTLAALPLTAQARLGRVLKPNLAATLDAALEAAEDALLAGHTPGETPPLLALLTAELADPGDAAAMQHALTVRDVAAGEALMTQGEASDDLVFLESGQASVTVAYAGAAPIRVRQFGPGTMIGEIGFLLGTPRTATVCAVTACRVRVLTRAAMRQLEAERPATALALQRVVMARLSLRVLDKDQLIAALMRGARRSA